MFSVLLGKGTKYTGVNEQRILPSRPDRMGGESTGNNGGVTMRYVTPPSVYRFGRNRKDFREGVLTYLWMIAWDLKAIREIEEARNVKETEAESENK